MVRDIWERFASKLESLDEAPEPLRGAMASALAAAKPRLLVFSPAWKVGNRCSPATLLAVLSEEWIVVSGTEEVDPTVYRASFADTLFIEFRIVLLNGRLTLNYAANGLMRSAVVEFNTVMTPFFDEAARLIRGAVSGVIETDSSRGEAALSALGGLPMKFVNAGGRFLPKSQRLLRALHWQSVIEERGHWLLRQRELGPEAMLALMECELILIADESIAGWTWFGQLKKYGDVVIYCPLARLAGFRINRSDGYATLQVQMRSGTGGGSWKAVFPNDRMRDIEALMARAINARKRTSGETNGLS